MGMAQRVLGGAGGAVAMQVGTRCHCESRKILWTWGGLVWVMTQGFKMTSKALKWFCGLHMTLHDFRGVPLTVFLRS